MPEAVASQALPQVFLRNLQIPLQVLQLVPLATVEKYQVAAFEVTDTTLKLAIVYPEQLKQGFYTALGDIGKRIGRSVQIFRTDHASMQYLVEQYRAQLAAPTQPPKPVVAEPAMAPPPSPQPPQSSEAVSPIVPAADKPVVQVPPPPVAADKASHPEAYQKPPLFEVGKSVAYNYLKRLPIEFSRAHHVICVDFLPPSTYWLATDRAEEPATKEIAKGIEKYNRISTRLLPLKSKEFGDLLEYYTQQKKEEELHPKEVEIEPVKFASDVVVPETQATIITQEQELPGISGLFQRFSQSISSHGSKPAPEQAEPAPIKLEPKPEPVAQPMQVAVPQPIAPKPIEPAAVQAPEPAKPVTAVAPPKPDAAPDKPQPTESKPAKPEEDDNGDIGKLLERPIESLDQLKDVIKKGQIPRIVAAVVNFAIHEKASDIHIESFANEVLVRYRVDGQLSEVVKMPPDVHAPLVSRIKILTKLRLDETRVPQDGRFEVNFDNAQVDLRVSLLPTVHGEKVVMRILDKNRGITSLEALGIQGLAYDNIFKSIQKPFGICLATGPTGSGKSTSLYAILKQIATPNVNVSTLEDPVEYEMSGINQSQIRPKIGFTFAEGLRSLLRQDPNIIMVGEIRDGETANMATQAALTGHLVLSTLHTNEASGAIPRLENMGIEPFLIASSLNMVIGQRLVRKICQNCKSEIGLPPGLKQEFAAELDKIRQLNPEDAKRIPERFAFYQGAGCDQCGGKGYQGRIGIYEVLVMSPEIERLTLARATGGAIQEQSQTEGMLTMYQDGLLKVLGGMTTLDEVLRETTNK